MIAYFLPTFMICKLYDSKPGFKIMNVYEGSIHACSQVDHKEKYEKDLLEF